MSLLLLAIALGVGFLGAFGLRWVSDDAFISFRYAQHLVEGHGLVFNVGEQVEGYTNFSWTVLVAAAMKLGLEPVRFTWVLGIACYLGCLVLLWRVSLRMSAQREGGELVVPVAALAWAVHHHAQVFATSGLETPLFVLLVTAIGVFVVEAQSPRAWVAVGALGAAACLTRPDGGLYYGLAVIAAGLTRENRRSSLVAVLVPGLGVGLPYVAWKLQWFGELLPNTFYAKAGSGPRWAEGVHYMLIYVQMYWVGLVGVLAALLLWVRGEPGGAAWRGRRGGRFLVAVLVSTCLYVGRVGGDFMFARFLVPVTPLAFLALEAAVGRLESLSLRRLVSVAAVLGVALAPYPEAISDNEPGSVGHAGVVEERDWYPVEWVAEAGRQGEVLSEMLQGTPARVAFHGTQAMLVYYGRVPYALEAHVGLTDRALARMPPPEGERVGHGVKADLALLRQRAIDLRLDFRLQQPVTELTKVDLGQGVTGRILTYRNEVMDVLRARGAQFIHFPSFLDAYIAEMDEMDDSKVQKEYASFSAYYFEHNDDSARQQAFESRLNGI
ncbi:MAG: hypothetical protein VX519_03100 [Myxococcota bacterium]|nr:hypothetical protein [Myxococcota bacterium]